MISHWNEPPLAPFGQMQQDIAAALGQAAAARADLTTKIEAECADIIAESESSGPAKGAAYRIAAERIRAVLAAAAPTQDGQQ